MIPEIADYNNESVERVRSYSDSPKLISASRAFMQQAIDHQYAYNFFWCGVPIVQIPQEIQAFQEIIWQVKPDCIIETGIAWGGSLIFSASMLCILESCGYISNGHVIGVDIDIREHNRNNISSHPLSRKISLLQGSSIDLNIFEEVKTLASTFKRILVFLDSNHTTEHVYEELKLYTSLIPVGSYCVVGDTGIDDYENSPHIKRPWGPSNGPKKAVHMFLNTTDNFSLDKLVDNKLLLTGSPDGYLKRIK